MTSGPKNKRFAQSHHLGKIKSQNIRKNIKDIHLVENNYELCLVYVRGAHHGGDTGLNLSDSSHSIGDLSEDLKSIVKTYVVRANYFGDRYVRPTRWGTNKRLL